MAEASPVLPKKTTIQEVLECPLCLHQLDNPHTLKKCLHSFCKACIDEVPKTSVESQENQGWLCPVCNTFSDEYSLKENSFIDILIKKQNNIASEEKAICKQCCSSNIEVNWKCMDCKIELCTNCKDVHLRIPVLKYHIISPLNPEAEGFIDDLVFCEKHNKPMEINCQECKMLLCFMCKLEDHSSHTMESVEAALEYMLPEIKDNKERMTDNMRCINGKIKAIMQKIKDTKKAYSTCKEELQNRMQEMIARIKAIKVEKEKEIDEQEKKAVKSLEDIKTDLEYQLKLGENLDKLVDITVENSRNMSLLNEFENGLVDLVSEMGNTEQKTMTLEIPFPHLDCTSSEDNNMEKFHKLFGILASKTHKSKISARGQVMDNQYSCNDLLDLFKKPMRKIQEVGLPKWCNRISFIDGKIWVPLPNLNEIQIYSTKGELMHIVDCPFFPLVVKQAANGEIFVGGNRGLYVSSIGSYDDTAYVKVLDGFFCDIAVYGDEVLGLEVNENKVVTLRNKHITTGSALYVWNEYFSFQLDETSEPHGCNTLSVCDQEILVAANKNHLVGQFTTKGNLIQSFKDHSNPGELLLCCRDKDENILLSNFSYDKLMIIDKNLQIIEPVISASDLKQVGDVIVDDEQNLWALQGNNDTFKLVKYSIQ